MTSELWRSCLVSLAMFGASLAAACTAPPDSSKLVDACATTAGQAFVAAGAAELGTGNVFVPVEDGQMVDVVAGTQGLHMFVTNVRVRELDVDDMNQRGGVTASAHDQSGVTLSMDYGCRTRGFKQNADGWLYADGPYNLPLNLDALARIDGATVTLQVEAHDILGHQAISTRTVVAHLIP